MSGHGVSGSRVSGGWVSGSGISGGRIGGSGISGSGISGMFSDHSGRNDHSRGESRNSKGDGGDTSEHVF